MQKAKWITLLAMVCICVLSISAYAQVPDANWPKFGRDYHNSSHNPHATSIAKSVPTWETTYYDSSTTPQKWDINGYVNHDGIRTDPNGNIYLFGDYRWALAKYTPNGVFSAYLPVATVGAEATSWFNGPTLFGDNTNFSFFTTLGRPGSLTNPATQFAKVTKFSWDGTTYAGGWISNPPITINYVNRYPGWASGHTPFGCLGGVAVAPNGRAYWGGMHCSQADPQGPIAAYNAVTGAMDWWYSDAINTAYATTHEAYGPGYKKGMGRVMGTYAIGYNDPNNIKIYAIGQQNYEHGVQDFMPSVVALSDTPNPTTGKNYTYLWERQAGETDPGTGQRKAGCFIGSPVLSDDESTLYCAGKEVFQRSRVVLKNSELARYEFFAYNTVDVDEDHKAGSVKFRLKTGGNHAASPALGSGNMIYVVGGSNPGSTYSSTTWLYPPGTTPTGMVVAIEDKGQQDFVAQPNGAEATYIKWKLILPDDGASDTSSLATVTVNGKNIIYVATGSARIYCIEDEGTYGKILWEYSAPELKPNSTNANGWFWSLTLAPPNVIVNDDGSVVACLCGQVMKFAPGFNPSSPEGLSGTVRDAQNQLVAGAWVSLSPNNQPLADNPNRLWTKTNTDGTYQITPRFAPGTIFPVTYNVAACGIKGNVSAYAGTANQTATFTAADTKVTLDFSLPEAKHNWAKYSPVSATASGTDYPARYGVDGLAITTRVAAGINTADLSSTTDKAPRWTSWASATPSYYIDLGADKKIGEAVIYWWWAAGASFTVDYCEEANFTDNSTAPYAVAYQSTVNTNRGFPIDYYGAEPMRNVPMGSGLGADPGAPRTSVDVINIPANVPAARYWRIKLNSAIRSIAGNYTTLTAAPTNPGFWEVELRDATSAPMAAYGTIGEAKNGEVGMAVEIPSAVVTAVAGGGVPAGSLVIEDENRTSGIRVTAASIPSTIQFGDKVSVTGKVIVDSVSGEKYLAGTTVARIGTKLAPGLALAEVAMSNKAASDSVSEGMFVKTWGTASAGGTDYFTLTDGSTTPIIVKCGSLTQPADGAFVTVRGVMGKNNVSACGDLGSPVLYMRNEQADIATGTDVNSMPLPFTGTYKYPIQYMVLSPINDATKTAEYMCDHAYITENASLLSPKAGDTAAGSSWSVMTSDEGKLDLSGLTGADNSVIYVFLNVWSPTTATVGLATGSDDWLKVWVNADTTPALYVDYDSFDSGRTLSIGQDTADITLNAGWNKILFKVINVNTGSCGLATQFTNPGIAEPVIGYGKYAAYPGLGYSVNP